MINLLEVSKKINEILNGVDNPLRIDNERVNFLVATEGYRLDKIADRQLGKNLIPVFIGLGGGENNPIPRLKQQSKSINIAIYYPIKYKDIFYDLEAYIGELLIGKMLNFGTLSGKCLTNMGVAQFGEITGMDFEQFKDWTGSVYRQTIEESSNWFSMQFTLYVTQLAEGFLFGNDTKFTINLKYRRIYVNGIVVDGVNYQRFPSGDDEDLYCWKNANDDFIYTKENISLLEENLDFLNGKVRKAYDNELETEYDIEDVTFTETEYFDNVEEELVWANSGTGANISPISQQLIGVDNFTKNVANITNYNKTMIIYPNPNTTFGAILFMLYNRQRLDLIENVKLIKEYSNGFRYKTDQLGLTFNENSDLGSPLSFTITLGDK